MSHLLGQMLRIQFLEDVGKLRIDDHLGIFDSTSQLGTIANFHGIMHEEALVGTFLRSDNIFIPLLNSSP